MQATTVDTKTVEALLQRGRTRMVQAYTNESGLIDPHEMHTYWRGFAQCAKALLDGSAQTMVLHDDASDAQGVVQAAFSRLPNDLERLTLANMKRHMWAQGINCAADLIAAGNVDAVPQLQHAVGAAIKQDDKHAISVIDVQDGGCLHVAAFDVEACIVKPGVMNISARELALINALKAILTETMAYPATPAQSSDSYLPEDMILAGIAALGGYGVTLACRREIS